MTTLHMLDTDTASYVIRGRSRAVADRLSALHPSSVCVSAVTRAELMYGSQRLPATHALRQAVRRFLEIVRTMAWDETAADLYADIQFRLTSTGRPIGVMDAMIAAHAVAAGAVLVTNNTRHFQRVPAPLRLANWYEDGGRRHDG